MNLTIGIIGRNELNELLNFYEFMTSRNLVNSKLSKDLLINNHCGNTESCELLIWLTLIQLIQLILVNQLFESNNS